MKINLRAEQVIDFFPLALDALNSCHEVRQL